MKRKQIPYKVRKFVFEKYGGRCNYCNIQTTFFRCHSKSFDPTRPGSIDHIIPIKHGGTDDLENLQLLCETCNASKGAKTNPPMSEIRGVTNA